MHDDDAVARQMHVELEAVGAKPRCRCRTRRSCFRARARCRRGARTPADAAHAKKRMAHGHRESSLIESAHGGHETLGDLRRSGYRSRPVKQEIRDNLVCKLRAGEPLFPGIIGYDETVIPQLVNAVLSRHNFILLGLRGQAKSRILRGLVDLLDERIPVVPGCEIHDDPARAAVRRVPRAHRRRRRPPADRVAAPRRALRREARDAGRDDRRHGRRHRSDQGGPGRAQPLRRADDALRPAAAREPRHLRDQRAARSGRQDSGRPVQHPAGRRRPD